MEEPVDPDLEAAIRRLYEAFNAREVEQVIALMADDVDWPNAIEGTRLIGREAVREYWRLLFDRFNPRLEPLGFEDLGNGQVRVRVHQSLHDLEGDLMGEGEVFHDHVFRDGQIERMDVVAAPA
ncbi:MAG: hypothetical protein QOI10_163 [Solirubrobacterales bacterium]|nr:hypothetical protein [Solirubrobacterales bacterium]